VPALRRFVIAVTEEKIKAASAAWRTQFQFESFSKPGNGTNQSWAMKIYLPMWKLP
jgi:hypothetical protein